jgi:hypothetical protein
LYININPINFKEVVEMSTSVVSYKVYQMSIQVAKNPHKLSKTRKFSGLPDGVTTISLELEGYVEVYSGKLENVTSTEQALGTIWRTFNINRPSDYKGHSLSVSDIVKVGREYYFCNNSGWVKIKVCKPTNPVYNEATALPPGWHYIIN